MFVAKVFIRPDGDVFIVRVAVVEVRSSRERICSICCARLVLQEDVVLFSFREVASDALSYFPGVAVVAEVGMISVHQDGDVSSFEQVRPVPQATHDGEEFPVINGVILLCVSELLGVESHWSAWSWLFFAIWECHWWIPLIEDPSCRELRCINLQLELSAGVGSDEDWCTSDESDYLLLSFLLFLSPHERDILAGKSCDRCGDC